MAPSRAVETLHHRPAQTPRRHAPNRQALRAEGSAAPQPATVRVSFVKVVEMQARAIPHIHALIRLDPPKGHATTATDGSGDYNDHGPAATCGGGEPRSAIRRA